MRKVALPEISKSPTVANLMNLTNNLLRYN